MAPTLVSPETLHPDTQAALLLCGTFGMGGSSDEKPLSLREYNTLAVWLKRQGLRPADLLQTVGPPFPADEPGLPHAQRIRALLERGVQMATLLEQWQRLGLWVLSRGEDCYPERLRRNLRSAAPVLLYGAGDKARLNRGGLAVVGSRDTDEEGLSFTRRVAERCAGEEIQIISGGARGVDRAAVLSALAAGGGAIAVLAERLDRFATSPEAKAAIRRGALTLVSPYEPEMGFTVGRAMGRNKHIYALADYALVVRFTTGEGGTWAGVVEQLGSKKATSVSVPVFVRVAHNPEHGIQDLCARGAHPFPEKDFWEGTAAGVLSMSAISSPNRPGEPVPSESSRTLHAPEVDSNSSPQTVSQAEVNSLPPAEVVSPTTPTVPEGETCYRLCLRLLLQSLREEPGEKDLGKLAARLDISLAQLKDWLKKAMEEGKVAKKKKGRKQVYVDVSLPATSGLFDRGDDAA